MAATRIFVAIPAMDELQELPLTLQDLSVQDVQCPVEVYICVNQPDNFWQLPEKHDTASANPPPSECPVTAILWTALSECFFASERILR